MGWHSIFHDIKNDITSLIHIDTMDIFFGSVISVDSYQKSPRKLPTTTPHPHGAEPNPSGPIASSNTPKVAAGTSWIFAWFRSPDNAWEVSEIFWFSFFVFFGGGCAVLFFRGFCVARCFGTLFVLGCFYLGTRVSCFSFSLEVVHGFHVFIVSVFLLPSLEGIFLVKPTFFGIFLIVLIQKIQLFHIPIFSHSPGHWGAMPQ